MTPPGAPNPYRVMAEEKTMIDKMKERREQLKAELATGARRLAELESATQSIKETMTRIAGAIQVLDEVIAEAEANPGRAFDED